MGRLRVKEDLPGRGDNVFVLVSHSHLKTSRLWTLAQDIISEREQRKKRRLEEARLVNLERQSH